MAAARFACPGCDKDLLLAKSPAPGQKVRCPACQTVFTPVTDTDSATAIQTRERRPSSEVARPSRRPRDDEDDFDDEEDDRPRRKRRRDDDWDDEPRPARSRRRRSSILPLAIGGGVAVVLLLFLFMGFVWPGFFRTAGAAPVSGDLMAFLPANTNAILGVDLSRQQNAGQIDQLRAALQNLPGAPVELADFLKDGESIIAGGNLDGMPRGGLVYRSRAPYDVNKVRKLVPFAVPKNVAGKECFVVNNGPLPGAFLGLPDDRTIVLGTSDLEADFSRAVGNRRPVLSADLLSQIQAIGKQEFWGVLVNDGKIKAGIQGIQLQQVGIVPGAADLLGPLQRARGFCFWAYRSGEKGAKFHVGANCANAADAGTVQTKLSELWQQGGKMLVDMGRGFVAAQPEGQALQGIFDDLSRSFAVERKGTLAFASIELSSKTVQVLEEQQKKLAAGPFNPQPIPQPPGKPPVLGKTIFSVKSVLNATDGKDPVLMRPAKIHKVALSAGKMYAIDLTSNQFDAFLRLQFRGQQLAQDDDGGGNLNARIIHAPAQTGIYEIVATSFNGKTGNYMLTVQELGAK